MYPSSRLLHHEFIHTIEAIYDKQFQYQILFKKLLWFFGLLNSQLQKQDGCMTPLASPSWLLKVQI